MRAKFYTGLFLVLGFTGCQEEEKKINLPDVFYAQSHQSFLQLKGNVKAYREYKKMDESDSQKQLVAAVSFNRDGNLAAYNPQEDENFSTYWLPVAQERFVYEYDYAGRLSEIVIYDTPESATSYKLKYGSHSDYILIPFELKPVGEWLVKGLVAIESNNPDFSFYYENGTALLTNSDAGFLKRVDYMYENGYPTKQTVCYYSGETVYSTETIAYQFDGLTGRLKYKKSVTEDVDFPESASWIYNESGLCISQTNDISGSTTVNTNSYNSQNWLTGISVKGDVKNGEHKRSYAALDNNGNWTECYLSTTGFVSWEFPEGEEILIREYSYR